MMISIIIILILINNSIYNRVHVTCARYEREASITPAPLLPGRALPVHMVRISTVRTGFGPCYNFEQHDVSHRCQMLK